MEDDIDQEPAHDVINVDLIAVANTTKLAWYGMRKEKRNGKLKHGGSIILTASMAVSTERPRSLSYTCVGLASHNLYMIADGIRSLCVAPYIRATRDNLV